MATERNKWKRMWTFCYITIYIILGTWIKSVCTDWILCMIKTLAHKNVPRRFLFFFLILDSKRLWSTRGEWLTGEWKLHVWNTRTVYLPIDGLIFFEEIIKTHALKQKIYFSPIAIIHFYHRSIQIVKKKRI